MSELRQRTAHAGHRVYYTDSAINRKLFLAHQINYMSCKASSFITSLLTEPEAGAENLHFCVGHSRS